MSPSRRALVALVIAFTLLLLAPVLRAQPAPPAAPCTGGVMLCSLRAEPTLLGGTRILRGPDGVEVGRLRLGGSDLPRLLAGSDSATAHARHFMRSTRASRVLGAVGAGLFVAAAVVDLRDREVTDAGLAYVAAGSVAGLISTGFELDARRALSRALWWYNAEMSRR